MPVAILLQRAAQVVQRLAGEVRYAGHVRMPGFTMACGAQTEPAGLLQRRGLTPCTGWNNDGEADNCDGEEAHRQQMGLKVANSSSRPGIARSTGTGPSGIGRWNQAR